MSEERNEGLLAQYERIGQEQAEAQAAYEQLDAYTKSLLALLMKKAENAGYTTAAMQEREARASEEFTGHLKIVESAQSQALGLRHMLKALEMRFEMWRTKEANERARINLR